MKKIMTTVGTSLFRNYMRGEVEYELGDDYEALFDDSDEVKAWEAKLAHEYDKNQDKIDTIKKIIRGKWFKKFNSNEPNSEASAEIKSILAITNDAKEDIDVYLLATDTVLSQLACELIKEWFSDNSYDSDYQINIQFNPKQDVLKGLQVTDKNTFEKEGLVKLIDRFNDIFQSYPDNCILNITGGYKEIIPYLTIFSQINQVPICYLFEDTDDLIWITKTVLSCLGLIHPIK